MQNNLKTIRTIFLIIIVAEAILAVPLIGGTLIIRFFYIPLLLTLILHIIALKEIQKTTISSALPITGIALTLFAWIPFFGWMSHIGLAIAYAILYFDSNKPTVSSSKKTKKTTAPKRKLKKQLFPRKK